MSNNKNAEQQKLSALAAIEDRIGAKTAVVGRRRWWRQTEDGKTSLFLTYSRMHNGGSYPFFYDVNARDLKTWCAFSRAGVVFVMGSPEQMLLVPAKTMREIVANLVPTGLGDIKLHLGTFENDSTVFFREAPDRDLSEFMNNFDF